MSQKCDRAGIFRCQIVEYGLYEPESGAVGVSVLARLDEVWNQETKEWENWRQYDVTADGTIWVIKKDGTINAQASESLIKSAGWNGSLEGCRDGTWQPTPCQFVVKEDDYNDDVRYRISFVNNYDRTPGAVGNVSADRAKALQTQYGAQFRALAGNANRNAAPPVAKPQTPKPASTATKAERPVHPDIAKVNKQFDEAMATESGSDDIPF
jgi:hypothetical protein